MKHHIQNIYQLAAVHRVNKVMCQISVLRLPGYSYRYLETTSCPETTFDTQRCRKYRDVHVVVSYIRRIVYDVAVS